MTGTDSRPKEKDALYYPYMHIRNEEWLKRTLLFFPHVARIVPDGFTPTDSVFIKMLAQTESRGEPLLREVELKFGAVPQEQHLLLTRLRDDLDADRSGFVARFGRNAARRARTPHNPLGFQMHPEKALYELMETLKSEGLAWKPDHPDHRKYLELHPALGEAVLGTVAVAAAVEEGLDIVGDGNDADTREMNRCVAVEDLEGIYDRWVRGKRPAPRAREARGEDLIELIIHHHCDASKITPANLKELGEAREPLAQLRLEFQKLASDIPKMRSEERLQRDLKARVNAAFDGWKKDRKVLSNAFTEMTSIDRGEDVADLVIGLAKKLGSGGAGATAGAALFPFIGAFAGFAVGLVVHAGIKAVKRRQTSSFRYLTLAERAGVIFTIGAP